MNRLLYLKRKARKKYALNLVNKNNNKIRFVFRQSCNHFYASIVQNGNFLITVNSIKLKRENKQMFRRDLISLGLDMFVKKFREQFAQTAASDVIYDIAGLSYSGNVKIFLDGFRKEMWNIQC